MSLSMSRAEREEFLAGLHVAVLGVAAPDGGGPLTVPVWYTYQPGGTVNLSTGRNTRKALAIAAAGRFSLCAQDERPPYKYVTVEGPAVMENATEAERLELARKYLGIEGGDAYINANPGGSQVMIRMTPEHWLSRAFGWAIQKQAATVHLWVTETNKQARLLYERCGFTMTGERQPLPSSPALGEIGMQRSL